MKKTILLALAAIIISIGSAGAQVADSSRKQLPSLILPKNQQPVIYVDAKASDYLKRGANQQIASVVVVMSGALLGTTISLAQSKSTSAGVVTFSISAIVGGILYISGVRNYRLAGIKLGAQGH
jgi:hypothetical protein